MNLLILLSAATLATLSEGSGVTIGLNPALHPIHSLYHSQDYNGQYTYGYATPMITRNEVRTMDGMTRGGYSYMDSNGILQTVHYTSDPIHGFQVAATNLPQDLPDVAAAKARHLALFSTISAERSVNAVPQVALPQPVQDLPEVVAARQAHLAAMEAARAGIMPQPVQDTPEVAKAKAEHLSILEATRIRDESLRRAINLSPVSQPTSDGIISVPSQPAPINSGTPVEYQPATVSNNLGLYSYGYVGPLSSQIETKNANGITRGGYSFIDANGKLQTVRYIADDINGFRVQATNLLTDSSLQNINTPSPVIPQTNNAPQEVGKIISNRGGFLVNVDNSLQGEGNIKDVLFTQETQF
ncbi:hypothetical protein HHI36_006959 [Cryptolaemus montrouzieri]|uniref:Cuticle protein 6 n=1 Tax=Cryptolaemus montrouzieri TaxID=559131 RepID=A0ABD2MN54_9CUCU